MSNEEVVKSCDDRTFNSIIAILNKLKYAFVISNKNIKDYEFILEYLPEECHPENPEKSTKEISEELLEAIASIDNLIEIIIKKKLV